MSKSGYSGGLLDNHQIKPSTKQKNNQRQKTFQRLRDEQCARMNSAREMNSGTVNNVSDEQYRT
jgi:serine phosphatase RsbU (regulator of sigma subunit)